MRLKFVYWFYAPKEDEFPLIYKYHFACLKRYINIFDDILIILAVEDVNDVEYINKLERKFLDLNIGKNLSFKIYKNDSYFREAIGFKNEIIDKLSTSEDLVFFGHSKGYTNIFSQSLKYWVAAMYYFSLNDIEKVKQNLVSDLSMFYGYIAMRGSAVCSKYKWHFPGSFYWLNCPCIAAEVQDIPKLTNRFYVEMFPGMLSELVERKNNHGKVPRVAWPGHYFLDGNYNFYVNSRYYLSLCFSKEEIEGLDKFVKELDAEVENF